MRRRGTPPVRETRGAASPENPSGLVLLAVNERGAVNWNAYDLEGRVSLRGGLRKPGGGIFPPALRTP